MLSLRLTPLLPDACQWCQRRISLVAQASKIPKRSNDDYHATLKALNSRNPRIPRKSLGQHYMLNSRINEQLSSIADLEEGDVVLEIGPGTGSLTNVLINAGATVIAVEKGGDPVKECMRTMGVIKMSEHVEQHEQKRTLNIWHNEKIDYVMVAANIKLKALMYPLNHVTKVLQEDITRCHICSHVSSLLQGKNTNGQRNHAKVVSNIPFNISTDVVKQLLPMSDLFSDVILLLQDETALRLTDFHLYSSEYRPINLFVNFYSDAKYKFKVERTNFFPQPNVDAAVVKFKLKQNSEYPQVPSRKGFFSMVNSAFNRKRKMLRKSLQHICSAADIESALRAAGLQVTARPQELTLDDFVKLYNLISYAEQSA